MWMLFAAANAGPDWSKFWGPVFAAVVAGAFSVWLNRRSLAASQKNSQKLALFEKGMDARQAEQRRGFEQMLLKVEQASLDRRQRLELNFERQMQAYVDISAAMAQLVRAWVPGDSDPNDDMEFVPHSAWQSFFNLIGKHGVMLDEQVNFVLDTFSNEVGRGYYSVHERNNQNPPDSLVMYRAFFDSLSLKEAAGDLFRWKFERESSCPLLPVAVYVASEVLPDEVNDMVSAKRGIMTRPVSELGYTSRVRWFGGYRVELLAAAVAKRDSLRLLDATRSRWSMCVKILSCDEYWNSFGELTSESPDDEGSASGDSL